LLELTTLISLVLLPLQMLIFFSSSIEFNRSWSTKLSRSHIIHTCCTWNNLRCGTKFNLVVKRHDL
jgi:hypothetical protein